MEMVINPGETEGIDFSWFEIMFLDFPPTETMMSKLFCELRFDYILPENM